ncbi:TetR/AcrR family transcriptional regulator [Ahrensia sp. AH-315-G08]|nr:TetR/AcrR family transcriptional regulator [Ahrensia sp. AH-315-G08]
MARTIAKDHDDKRQLILKSAASVFAAEGFDRASMTSVAGACQISKANIYHYYPSKDDILFDILDTHLSRLRDRIISLNLSGQKPVEQFHTTVLEILLAYRGADNEHLLQINALPQLPDDKQAVLRKYQSQLVDHMSGLVYALSPRRFNNNKADLHAVTMSIFGMLNWFYMWNKRSGEKARLDYAQTICELTLNGIKPA